MEMKSDLSPKTKRGEKTRRKLLDGAEIVFGKYGYFEKGIVEITQEANVSLGTFYNYFESKYDIFAELVGEMQFQLYEAIREETKGVNNRIEKERKGFKAFFQYLKEHRYLYRIYKQTEFVDEELHKKYFDDTVKRYSRGLQKAMDKGEIKQYTPEILAVSLMGLLEYVGTKWINWENKEIDDALIDEVIDFIRHGLAVGQNDSFLDGIFDQ